MKLLTLLAYLKIWWQLSHFSSWNISFAFFQCLNLLFIGIFFHKFRVKFHFVNFKLLLYSLNAETKNNLKTKYKLNIKSVDLIKRKSNDELICNRTALLLVNNLFRENMKVKPENKKLYEV